MPSFLSKISHFLDKFHSTADVNARINDRLKKENNEVDLREEFIYGCNYLWKRSQFQLLSDLIREHEFKIQASSLGLTDAFVSNMKAAAEQLKNDNHVQAAISLYRLFAMQHEYYELLFDLLLNQENLKDAKRLIEELPENNRKEKNIKLQETALQYVKSHLQKKQFEQALEDAEYCAESASTANQVLEEARAFTVEITRTNSSLEAMREGYRRLAILEGKAGNSLQAGKIAEEILKDYQLAADFYEKANLYYRAIALVSKEEETTEDMKLKQKLATLHKNGGNLLEAAKLFEELQAYGEAAPIYEELQQYRKALECYLKLGDEGREHTIDLYCKCGRPEEAVNNLIQSNQIADIERALNLAKKYNLVGLKQEAEEILERLQDGFMDAARELLKEVDKELSETYAPILGIDFGTTNSVGAIYNKKKQSTEIIPVPGSNDVYCEPSCFGIDENGSLLYGEAARRYSITHADNVAFYSKRVLGVNSVVKVQGHNFRPEEIAASIIDHVKQNAVIYLQEWRRKCLETKLHQRKMSLSTEALSHLIEETRDSVLLQKTVLTIPAFYDNNRKQATRTAAEIAGLQVVRLTHEPSAAAIKYFLREKHVEQKVCVVDLGGGTLDLSFLQIGDGVYEVVSINGNIQLGGKDIDDLLVDYAKKDINERYHIDLSDKQYKNECARLRDGCENLKIHLSSVNRYTMVLPAFLNIEDYHLELTREQLESIIQPFLAKFKTTLEKAVEETRANGFVPGKVILVGNATRMPAVERIVSQVYGMETKASSEAGTLVAAGAALMGAVLSKDLSDLLLLDVVPYSLNIVVKDHNSDKQICQRMIERNTTIPTLKEDTFSTTSDNQTVARVVINQGESDSPENNYQLGSVELTGIPPAKAGTPVIKVKYEIDQDCILVVTAWEEQTGNKVSVRINNAVLLNPDEKKTIHRFFNERNHAAQKQKKRDHLVKELQDLLLLFEEAQTQLEREEADFNTLFTERVEQHPGLYDASMDTVAAIKEMYSDRDEIQRKKTRCIDVIATIRHNLELEELKKRQEDEVFQFLSILKDELTKQTHLFQKEVIAKYQQWNQFLKGMKLNTSRLQESNLSLQDAARALMVSGDELQARSLWERVLAENGSDAEAFKMILRCDVKLGEFQEYSEHHRKYGALHGVVYPDFNALNIYLDSIRDSIFFVVCTMPTGIGSGTAFAIGTHWLATCRHVIEGISLENIKIIGNGRELTVCETRLGTKYDVALIKVMEATSPLRMGEFPTASPGESVLAVGFPRPTSFSFDDNLSVSRGVINSVRRESEGRLIYMDAKITGGNSGGPLVNSLGEVIGINTSLKRSIIKEAEIQYIDFEQPCALPIWQVRHWLEENMTL